MKEDKAYLDWRRAVDKRLDEIYCLTTEDAGFNEEYLVNRWQSSEAPFEFVEWFGNKYDLDPLLPPVRPRMFELTPPLEKLVHLSPLSYEASFW